MTTKPVPKRCVACGLQKPISAFLQINGPQGTTYGNVCSTCRGSTGLVNKIVLPATTDRDGQSSSTLGLKIDSKSKAFADRENKERLQQKEEKKAEESKKRDQISEKKTDSLDHREKSERRHREEYIERPKTFLDKTPAATPAATDAPVRNAALTDQQRLQQDTALREEADLKTPNLSNAFIDPAIAGGVGFNSEGMLRMRDWLGGAAPINRLKQILATPAQTHTAAPTPAKEAKPQDIAQIKLSQMKTSFNTQQAKNTQTTQTEKKTLVEQIKETWQPNPPNSTRRR